MRYQVKKDDCLGFVRPSADAHTLGMSSLAALLADCGIPTHIAGMEVCRELEAIERDQGLGLFRDWLRTKRITVLGFSYRLDPADGVRLFSRWYRTLREKRFLASDGGPVRAIYFAGLPEACALVEREFPGLAGLFRGDETPAESLAILGLDPALMPAGMAAGNAWDEARLRFGRALVARGEYRNIRPVDWAYPDFGTEKDTVEARVAAGRLRGLPPLMRAHVGPYTGDTAEDLRQFRAWTRELAAGGLLDVLSIGSSQLTQSHFFADRQGLQDGGGISIGSGDEYAAIWQDARPMLVRTYAGTRDIPKLAALHESRLHIAWHALSFWWFCQLDGRGPHGLRENLEQHFQTMDYAAATHKPLEPNVPNHYAFRGADDFSYVVAGFLAAKAAKQAGIQTLILQVMLNTPKQTWGLQDVAKARALRELVHYLEDRHFRVLLQPRGGLDYFSPDLEKAKAQLAAVTALMTELDTRDPRSPAIIHVVSYSEAVRLADPPVINESIRITRQALKDYRKLKATGAVEDLQYNEDLDRRVSRLYAEARTVIDTIEALVPDPYSPAGFEAIFAAGFLPVPWLWECREQYPAALAWNTRLIDGGVQVVDETGRPVPAAARMAAIRETWKGGRQ